MKCVIGPNGNLHIIGNYNVGDVVEVDSNIINALYSPSPEDVNKLRQLTGACIVDS